MLLILTNLSTRIINLCFQIKQCSITVGAMGCPPLTHHSVSSLAPTEIDYVYSTAKAPLRPEEPEAEGGKALILLFKIF